MPVNRDGLVDKEKLEESISEKTAVVSIMLANNEIGTIQPIQELSENCTAKISGYPLSYRCCPGAW